MNTNYKTGLSNKEVLISRSKFGSNKLTSKKKNTFLKLIIESLGDPIIKILLISLCIKLLILFSESNIYETLGIVVAIFMASFISALSEYGSEKAFEKLNSENSMIKVKVLRNSKKETINIDEVVVGDIIYLESGDKIPADGKIIEGEVYVDESALTGETKEKHKDINDNLVFMGSIITDKRATMIVTLVGDKTFYGHIASAIQEKTIESPLKSKLRVLAGQISKMGYISAVIVFLSYIINVLILPNNFNIIKIISSQNLIPTVIYGLTLSVSVIVMAVPEGLPMMITLVLSSNMKRMLRKNILVRKLVGIETSGSLNILFTDKTGTLTEGKLKVESFTSSNLKEYRSFDKIKNNYEIIYQSLIYNNDSFISKNSIEGGNTTDKAIMHFCQTDNKNKYEILKKVDFNSKIKYSSVTTNYNNKTTFIKGAYEIIIKKCNKILEENGKISYLIDYEKINNVISEHTKKGKRVLALAMTNTENVDNLTLIGFVIMKDNIRKNTKEGLELIKKANIQVTMVTGDSKETAIAVAKELEVFDSKQDICLTSSEFNSLGDNEIMKILPKLKILCRSLPEDKNRLVRISQNMNLVVGMTGDGVNDSPALKKADVGFSMGSGTEIAKETSDIIILDNNIKSISTAILYGRTIFKSIRKFIVFQLTVNVCAVSLSIIGPYIGVATPVTVIQILWINMVMDTLAGLAFAFEPALKEYMYELPKKRSEKIINSYMKNQIICNSIYSSFLCIWFLKSPLIKSIYRYDIDSRYLMTAFFGLFIFISIFDAFNSRTHRINILSNIIKNKVFLIIVILIAIVQVILIYYGGEIFRTTGLTLYEFEIMILIAFSIIPFDIIRKSILKKIKIVRGF